MKDRHARRLFELSLEGGLEGAERERFEAHLAACGKCAAEYETARTVRRQLQALPEAALAGREAAGMAARLERDLNGRVPASRVLSYSLAAAVALLLLVMSGRFDSERLLARGALSLDAPEMQELSAGQAQARLAREVLDGLEAHPLASFDSPVGSGAVSIAGFVQPGFWDDPALGRGVLRVSHAGSRAQPLQLIVSARSDCRVSAVSAWIFCEDSSATVSLEAVLSSGRVIGVTPVRRVDAMEWQWVVFRLPLDEPPTGETLREFRLGVRGDTAVRFDSLEAWCNEGPR